MKRKACHNAQGFCKLTWHKLESWELSAYYVLSNSVQVETLLWETVTPAIQRETRHYVVQGSFHMGMALKQ